MSPTPRGGDASADWVLLVQGYDAAILAAISAQMFSDARLVDHGASPGAVTEAFQLSHALTAATGGHA